MADPLYRVLGDARWLYRRHATWLLCVSAALFVPAAALDVLITGKHGPGAWCDAAGCSAAFLLLAIVTARAAAKVREAFALPSLPRAGAVRVYLVLIAVSLITILIAGVPGLDSPLPAAGAG
jgi:hypothetical protein